jgi:serine/threonine protein kinase
MHQLLEALAFIHDSSVIQRDVKPTNCLFNVDSGELMLIDFGFAELEPVCLLFVSPCSLSFTDALYFSFRSDFSPTNGVVCAI